MTTGTIPSYLLVRLVPICVWGLVGRPLPTRLFGRHKTWTHEGGTSTPLIVSWPKGISAKGELRRNPGHVIDIVPTLLDVAGAKANSKAPKSPGHSLVPVFSTGKKVDHDSLWWFHDGHRAIRAGNWKAVSPLGEPWELYDLSTDRTESTDLAIPQKTLLRELVQKWESQLAEFTELAGRDLNETELRSAQKRVGRSPQMNKAQAAALPKRRQTLLSAKTFLLKDRHAFVMVPEKQGDASKPWIFYAPTLDCCPDTAEQWMHQQFLDAGIAVAGIDVGEAYGSPYAFEFFDALYDHMVSQGYSKKPVLLGRSRGGLWASSWALHRPDRVAGIGGIYPVYDFTSYPGVKRAAVAYGKSQEELVSLQAKLNPVRRASELAAADIPIYIIHGDIDKVVPIEKNSLALQAAYQQAGKSKLIQVQRVPDQGHNFWKGFFHHQPLVDFLITKAKAD